MAAIKTYVTFGQAHCHVIGDSVFDKECVAVIHHDDSADGRALAFECFGTKFCFEYSEKSFDMGSMRFFPRGFINVNDPPIERENPLEWSKKHGLEEF